MRIGIVANWCNRGQGVMARQIRSIFHEAGHETFVLARPTNPYLPNGSLIDTRGGWSTEGVTHASSQKIPENELLLWAAELRLDVVFFDMNRQYREIAALRKTGVRTIGRFVWEQFLPEDKEEALAAFDSIYSLTLAEQKVYQSMGIDSPYARWGIHPELLENPVAKRTDAIYFIFHGGLQGRRKPIAATVRAFKAVSNPRVRLIIKSQGVRECSESFDITDDQRIQHLVEDLDDEEYKSFYASCHVSLAPARWEGLGVHLFESIAFGMPVISSNIPPINEVIAHNKSGLLVNSNPCGIKKNGLIIFDPDEAELTSRIEELSDPDRLDELVKLTRAQAIFFNWDNTSSDYLALAGGTL